MLQIYEENKTAYTERCQCTIPITRQVPESTEEKGPWTGNFPVIQRNDARFPELLESLLSRGLPPLCSPGDCLPFALGNPPDFWNSGVVIFSPGIALI
jgi:hypothetical protein